MSKARILVVDDEPAVLKVLGLICSLGSFLCGTIYLSQILFRNFSDSTSLMLIPGVKNILAKVFLTGFLAPFVCSQLLRMFKFSRRNLY